MTYFKRTTRIVSIIGTLAFTFSSVPSYADTQTPSVSTESIDVFAIPSQPIVDLVKKTSDQLNDYGMTSFYRQGKPIHITLYLSTFDQAKEKNIQKIVSQLAEKYHALPISAKGFTVTKGKWVFINVDNSTELQRLADEVTLAIEPLRNKNSPIPDWVANYPNKKAAFERYGSPNVFQNFAPHLTLLAEENSPELINFSRMMTTQQPKAQGAVIGIGVGITDKWGQQKKILGEYLFTHTNSNDHSDIH